MTTNQPSPTTQRTIWLAPDGRIQTLDQTRLPFEQLTIQLDTVDQCAHAIRTMQVRGAPLIGAVGAYGLALALRDDPSDSHLAGSASKLLATRPTAVNLRWALERVSDLVRPLPPTERPSAAWQQAALICDEDVASNRQIGVHTLALLQPLIKRAAASDQPLQILTHCNAGRIATVGYGTALAPIYLMAEQGLPVHVWVDETRPRNQGASLTAWELADAGIPHTVIADNAGGLMMMRGEIDAVIIGCDRVASNGDVVNKIGTYLKALAAAAHAIPFYVACPTSTIDMRCASGAEVPIEFRDTQEVTHMSGVSEAGLVTRVRITPADSNALNPAFDITPATLVTKLITQIGVVAASTAGIASLALAQSAQAMVQP